MNLPATAIEFLDVFRGLYRPLYQLEGAREAVEKAKLLMVHCYCFTKDVEHPEEDICSVSASLFPRLGWTLVVFLAENNQGAGNPGDEPDGGLQASLREGRRAEEGDVLLGVSAVEGDGRVGYVLLFLHIYKRVMTSLRAGIAATRLRDSNVHRRLFRREASGLLRSSRSPLSPLSPACFNESVVDVAVGSDASFARLFVFDHLTPDK